MPTLLLPNGTKYKYKTIPLFPGVKLINKDIASDNLHRLRRYFEREKIPFQLAAGTLLGAIRDKDFISHDEDIDLALLEKDREKFLNLLPSLRSIGFELCRFDRRDLYSLMRNGEYIDLYFFHPYNIPELSICSGWIVKTIHLIESDKIIFKGEEYLIPKNFEEYLLIEYGDDWRTPKVWNNYNQSKLKVCIFNLKEYIKDYLPSPIFKLLAIRAEQKMIEKTLAHLKRVKE